MQERVLDLRRRFLPDNDPEIGDHDVHSDSLLHVSAFFVKRLQYPQDMCVCLMYRSGVAMNNIAQTYKTLGRLADALAMSQRVLEFRRRVLPENHPSIG